jgi:hypothetical protein
MRLRFPKRQQIIIILSLAMGIALIFYSIALYSDNHKLRAENKKLIAQSTTVDSSKPTNNYLPQAQEALNAFLGVEEQNVPTDEGSLVSQLLYCDKQYGTISTNSNGTFTEPTILPSNSPTLQKEQNCEYGMVASYIDDIQNNTGTVTSGTYLNGILNQLQPGSY